MDLKQIFIFSFFFIAITFASPVSLKESRCSRYCKAKIGPQKFSYEEKKTYVYDYESTHKIMQNGPIAIKPLTIRAKLEISNLDYCEMVLEVKNARLFISGNDEGAISELMLHPLLFSFEDGKIEEICPHPEELPPVINMKRAMLSALQNTMQSFEMDYDHRKESDIVGTCMTIYGILERNENEIVIKKSKNLADCWHRRTGNTALLTTFLPNSIGIPIMYDEFYDCEQIVKNGILTNATCIEHSKFNPLKEDRIYNSKAEISLYLINILPMTDFHSYEIKERDHLLYSHQPEKYSKSASGEAIKVLQDMCRKINHPQTIDPELPSLFSRLVRTLRIVHPQELVDIYDKLKSGYICSSPSIRNLADDALPHIGHEGSVRVMVKKIRSGSVCKIHSALWVTSLAFIENPTEDIILAAVPLLDYEKAEKEAILGITAMSNSYCKKNTNCEHSRAIQQVIRSLSKYLNYGSKVSGNKEINQIITALKGFGNLGRVGDATRQILQCAAQTSNKITIRLAAIEAFRRTPCAEDVRDQLYDIFSRSEEPVEVRIAAYLGVMKCADREMIRKIKQVYDSESLIQIKAFIYSHVLNLKKSSSPLKEDIRRILLEFQFQPQPLDIRKYSQYSEWSSYVESMKTGGEFESSIVYSQNSFIPRSFMANFTSFLQGNILNLIEVGGRIEGLDYLMENLFSPAGKYGHMSFSEFASHMLGVSNKTSQLKLPRYRTYHKYQPKIDLFSKKMKATIPSEAHGSFYFKHHGNELLWVSIDEKTDFSFGKAVDFMDILSELARKKKIDTAQSLYLDTSIIYPSISGGALTLDVAGAVILGLKSNGKLDIRKVLTSSHGIDIDGKASIGVAGEITAEMKFKSLSKTPNIKYIVKAHGNAVVKGKLVSKDGRLLNIRIDLPDERVDVLSVSAGVIQTDEHERHISVNRPKSNFSGCLKMLRNVMGFDICTEGSVPKPILPSESPLVPFNGPLAMKISLLKVDHTMHGYLLNIELPDKNVYNTKKFKFEFDTPGSSLDRKYSLEIVKVNPSNDDHAQSLHIHLQTPYKAIEARAATVNSEEKKSLKLDFILDQKDHWAFLADIGVSKIANYVDYEVVLKFSRPNRKPITILGSISYMNGILSSEASIYFISKEESTFQEISGLFNKDGVIEISRKAAWRITTNLGVSLKFMNLQIKSMVQYTGVRISSDLKIDYIVEGEHEESFEINFNAQDLSSLVLSKTVMRVKINSTQYPQYNAQLDWNYEQKTKQYLENELILKGGSDLRKQLNVIQRSEVKRKDRQNVILENMLAVTAPEYGINYELKVAINHNGGKSNTINAEIKKDLQVCASSYLYYYLLSKNPLQMGIEFDLKYPGRTIRYSDEINQISPEEFKGKTAFQWQEGHQIKFDYTYKIQSHSDNVHHEVDAAFDAPWLHVPMKHRGLLRMSRNSVDIKSSTSYEGKSPYNVDIKLSPNGQSKVNVDLPAYGKSDVYFDVSGVGTLLKFDISRPKTNRRIIGQVTLTKRPKPIAKLEVSWDADRDPSSRLLLETEAQKVLSRTEKYFAVVGKFRYKEIIYFDTRGKFDSKILRGPHDLQLDVKQTKPISIKMHYEAKDGILKSEFNCKHENKQFQAMATGKYLSQRIRMEIVCDAAISSSSRRWDGKRIHFSHTQDFSDSPTMKSLIQINETPEKQYKFKSEYSRSHSRSSGELKGSLLMQTPIRGWKTREINISLEQKRNNHTFKADLITDLGKKLIVYNKVEKNQHGANLQYLIQLPTSKIMQKAKIQLFYHLQPSKYKIQGQISVDDQTKLQMNGILVGSDIRNFDSNLEFKSHLTPAFASRVNSKMDSANKKFDVAFTKDSVEKFSGTLSAESYNSLYNGEIVIGTEGRQIIDMVISCQHKSAEKQECLLNLSGAIKPTTITLIYRKEKSLIIPTFKICQKTEHTDSECIEIEGRYRNENNYGTALREVKMNIKRPKAGDISAEFVNSVDKYSYKNKLLFMSSNMKLGYDAFLNFQSPSKSGQVQLYFPSRVIEAKGNFQTERGVSLISEFLLDAERQPLKKLSLEFTHKDNHEKSNRQIFSKIDLKHPEFRKPISAKFELRSREAGNLHPIDAKVELDYSYDPKHKIICNIHMETTIGQGNNTLVFNLHKAERKYLDFTVKTHLGYLRKQMTCGLEWDLLSQRSRKKSGFTLMRIDPQQNTFGIWHQCDLTNFEGTGKWTSTSDNVFKTEFNFFLNDREPKKITAISYVQSCIDLAYHAKADEMPKSKYHFCVNSATRNLLSISANAFYDTAKVTDLSLVFDRNSNRAFTLDLKWMPEIYRKLLKYFPDLYVQMQKKFAISSDVLKLFQDTITTLRRDFIEPLHSFLSREFSRLSHEVQDNIRMIKESLRQQYKIISTKYEIENTLQYLRKYIKDTFYELTRFKRAVVDSVKKNIRDFTGAISSQIDSVCNYSTYCYKLKLEFQRHGLKSALKELYKYIADVVYSSTRIKIKFGDLGKDILKSFQDILNSLKRLYNKIEWKSIINWTSIIDSMMNHARPVGKAMVAIEKFVSQHFSRILEKIKNIKNNIFKNRDVKNVISILKEIRKQLAEELKNVKVEQLSRRLKDSFFRAFSSFSLKDTIFVFVFNPDQGKLKTEIFLPGLKHTLKALKRPTDNVPSWIPQIVMSLLVSQPTFPPISADAVIINGQYFKTFDGSVFNISDDCSYLLTHDFGDENFTIISKHIDAHNYEPSQKSIVILNPEFSIEINPFTSTILLNDAPIELPFYANTVSLTRSGDIINALDKRGVEVKCHLVYKFCAISLSGWYFRKTGGLFGTFDYEPSNDFLDANGNLVESVKQFAQGWKVSSSCKPNVHFTQQTYQSDNKMCQKLFSYPDSPFRSCFNQVPPDDYLKMCLFAPATKFTSVPPPEPVCDVAASYATVCQKYGHRIILPSECLNCMMSDGAFIEYGEETKLHVDESNRHSLDVVYIFEENSCNVNLIKKIDEFTSIFERLFNSGGFVNNRYALVAYGGKNEEYKAHIHTAHGQIFFNVKDIPIAIKNVKLNFESHDYLDVYAVILFANDLPFREKVNKLFILIPCGKCVSSAMSINYHDIMKKLSDSGVYFHVLTSGEILRQYSSSERDDSKAMSSGDDIKVLELPGWRIPIFSNINMNMNDSKAMSKGDDIKVLELPGWRIPIFSNINMNDTKAISTGDDIKVLELPGWKIPFFSNIDMNILVFPGWRIPLDFDDDIDVCTSLAIDLRKTYSYAEQYKENSFSKAQTWPAFSQHISSISQSYCKICKCVQDEHHVPRIHCKPCPEINI